VMGLFSPLSFLLLLLLPTWLVIVDVGGPLEGEQKRLSQALFNLYPSSRSKL
jgi:hypothetical protein